MKTIKLNQNQLRSLIKEAMDGVNPDEEMGRKLAEIFTTMLSPEPTMLRELTEELASWLLHHDHEAFFPVRYEDIEPMSHSAARVAAEQIVRSPDFISFLADALARAYRKVGLEK